MVCKGQALSPAEPSKTKQDSIVHLFFLRKEVIQPHLPDTATLLRSHLGGWLLKVTSMDFALQILVCDGGVYVPGNVSTAAC